MQAHVEVMLRTGGPWLPALLTTDRAESSYGSPVVVVEDEDFARGPAEVYAVKGFAIDPDEPQLLKRAQRAGFTVLGLPRAAPSRRANP